MVGLHVAVVIRWSSRCRAHCGEDVSSRARRHKSHVDRQVHSSPGVASGQALGQEWVWQSEEKHWTPEPGLRRTHQLSGVRWSRALQSV